MNIAYDDFPDFLFKRDQPFPFQVNVSEDLILDCQIDKISLAFDAGHVRLIDEKSSNNGYSIEWLAEQLQREVSEFSDELVTEILDKRLCTIAVQSFEKYDKEVANFAELLRTQTARRVTVTAFISPPNSRGTSIHYDRSDVVIVHLEGKKRWKIYEPIDFEPNHRTPYCDPKSLSTKLTCMGDLLLERGSALFLPSGWVHEVVNEGDKPSLHLSFVIFSDALISIFGNVMTEVYAKMMLHSDWRKRVNFTEVNRPEYLEKFNIMLNEFSSSFMETIAIDPSRFCDHVLNFDEEEEQRLVAMNSISNIQSNQDDVIVKWVGVHHRAIRNGSKVEVSVDGNNRYGINFELYSICKTRKSLSLIELSSESLVSDDEIINFIVTMVQSLGLLALTEKAST